MDPVPRPDWFDKPHEEWPPEAREFYRLLFVGAARHIKAQAATPQAGLEDKARKALQEAVRGDA